MKRLTCEMCGGTDMIKQDGVFVCQSCGCKYSVEEAKKMMIEGTVDVKGTIQIDYSAQIENFIELSKKEYSAGNGKAALEYANKALEISPKNHMAWIAKMKSLEHVGTIGDPKVSEIVEAGQSAIDCADESIKSEISFEVAQFQSIFALKLLQLATTKLSDTAQIEDTLKLYARISVMSAPANTQKADRATVDAYNNLASLAVKLLLLIPDEIMNDNPNLSKTFYECAKEYQRETEALDRRYKVYYSELLDSAKKTRKSIMEAIEDKANAAIKVSENRKAQARAERIAEYWKAHASEKAVLESKRTELEKQVEKLANDEAALPALKKKKKLEDQVIVLCSEKSSVGIFNIKERKAIQNKIDSVKEQCKVLEEEVSRQKLEISRKKDSLKNKINAINEELEKDR